jgi:hypothetical protein
VAAWRQQLGCKAVSALLQDKAIENHFSTIEICLLGFKLHLSLKFGTLGNATRPPN